MRRSLAILAFILAAALTFAQSAPPAHAEAATLRVAKQFGLGYLQFMVMQDKGLIEKHAKAAGLGDVTTEWATFRSSDVMNDALISGSVDFVSLGVPGLITIWSKTRGSIGVKGASAINAAPLFLNVRDPSIKSLADFKDNHRIALPAVKVAMQAIMLQMAAAKAFGENKYNALDHLTVSMSHPDATAAMLGGPSEVTANFSSPPFQYRQLKNPNIHVVLKSSDLVPEGVSFNVIATTTKFRADNPKLYGAFLAALREATDIINADKAVAAEIYLRVTGEKTPLAEIKEVLAEPDIVYTTKPLGIQPFMDFMAKIGTLRGGAVPWTEMFFPEGLAGVSN
jgi:NitT/TauT family transport system substrate-binding protein